MGRDPHVSCTVKSKSDFTGDWMYLYKPSRLTPVVVPAGSPSRGGDVVVYFRHKPTELGHFFFFLFCPYVLSVSVFMALSTVFHFIISPDNSPLSDSVFPVLILPFWSFQLFIAL